MRKILPCFTPKKRIIIDTKNGVDEIIALLVALASDEAEVLAITTPADMNEDLQKICKIAGKNIPVLSEKEAVNFVINTLNVYPSSADSDVYLASMGDFSVFAKAFEKKPETMDKFKLLAVGLRNISPKANKSIFLAKEKIAMLGEWVSDTLCLPENTIQKLAKKENNLAKYLADEILKNLAKTGSRNFMLYNPIIMACILKPALCSGIFCGVSITKKGDESFVADFSWDNKNILRIDNINESAFLDFLDTKLSLLS